MRLGCCGTIEHAAEFKAAGFDFLEVNVQQVLQGDLLAEQWDPIAPDPDKIALPVEAANCLVPGHRPIIGPQRDFAGLHEYMKRIALRAQRLGMKRLVFGSGGARKKPDNVDNDTAFEHLAEFTRMAGEVCAHHDILIVIEHLNQKETNTINKLAQARFLCDRVAHPNVTVLVDSYHYGLEHEKDEAILELGDRIRHVHVAEPIKRIEPGGHGAVGVHPDAFDFEHFFCVLRKAGYNERVSIESSWSGPFPEVALKSIAYLRQCWDTADKCEA